MSSSHRGIFARDYAEEYLPLDKGITTGTLQFHKQNFHYLRKLQFQHFCVLQKETLYIFYTVVSAFYSAGRGHNLSINRFNSLMKSLLQYAAHDEQI